MSAVQRTSQILLVGPKIRQIRKSRHLTQADLASRIGVTQSDLSRMENGEYKVGLDTLFRILHVFELSLSHFFEEPGAEASAAGTSPADALPAGMPFDDAPLARDWAGLPEDSRREVREFVAFKKMQADKTRAAGSGEEAEDDQDGNRKND